MSNMSDAWSDSDFQLVEAADARSTSSESEADGVIYMQNDPRGFQEEKRPRERREQVDDLGSSILCLSDSDFLSEDFEEPLQSPTHLQEREELATQLLATDTNTFTSAQLQGGYTATFSTSQDWLFNTGDVIAGSSSTPSEDTSPGRPAPQASPTQAPPTVSIQSMDDARTSSFAYSSTRASVSDEDSQDGFDWFHDGCSDVEDHPAEVRKEGTLHPSELHHADTFHTTAPHTHVAVHADITTYMAAVDYTATSDHTAAVEHAATADLTATSDHTAAVEHAAIADLTATSDHTAATEHTAIADHTASAEHTATVDHTTTVQHLNINSCLFRQEAAVPSLPCYEAPAAVAVGGTHTAGVETEVEGHHGWRELDVTINNLRTLALNNTTFYNNDITPLVVSDPMSADNLPGPAHELHDPAYEGPVHGNVPDTCEHSSPSECVLEPCAAGADIASTSITLPSTVCTVVATAITDTIQQGSCDAVQEPIYAAFLQADHVDIAPVLDQGIRATVLCTDGKENAPTEVDSSIQSCALMNSIQLQNARNDAVQLGATCIDNMCGAGEEDEHSPHPCDGWGAWSDSSIASAGGAADAVTEAMPMVTCVPAAAELLRMDAHVPVSHAADRAAIIAPGILAHAISRRREGTQVLMSLPVLGAERPVLGVAHRDCAGVKTGRDEPEEEVHDMRMVEKDGVCAEMQDGVADQAPQAIGALRDSDVVADVARCHGSGEGTGGRQVCSEANAQHSLDCALNASSMQQTGVHLVSNPQATTLTCAEDFHTTALLVETQAQMVEAAAAVASPHPVVRVTAIPVWLLDPAPVSPTCSTPPHAASTQHNMSFSPESVLTPRMPEEITIRPLPAGPPVASLDDERIAHHDLDDAAMCVQLTSTLHAVNGGIVCSMRSPLTPRMPEEITLNSHSHSVPFAPPTASLDDDHEPHDSMGLREAHPVARYLVLPEVPAVRECTLLERAVTESPRDPPGLGDDVVATAVAEHTDVPGHEAVMGFEGQDDEAVMGFEGQEDEGVMGLEVQDDEAGMGLDVQDDEAVMGFEVQDDEAVMGLDVQDDDAVMGLEVQDDEAVMGLEALDDEAVMGLEAHDDEAVMGLEAQEDEPMEGVESASHLTVSAESAPHITVSAESAPHITVSADAVQNRIENSVHADRADSPHPQGNISSSDIAPAVLVAPVPMHGMERELAAYVEIPQTVSQRVRCVKTGGASSSRRNGGKRASKETRGDAADTPKKRKNLKQASLEETSRPNPDTNAPTPATSHPAPTNTRAPTAPPTPINTTRPSDHPTTSTTPPPLSPPRKPIRSPRRSSKNASSPKGVTSPSGLRRRAGTTMFTTPTPSGASRGVRSPTSRKAAAQPKAPEQQEINAAVQPSPDAPKVKRKMSEKEGVAPLKKTRQERVAIFGSMTANGVVRWLQGQFSDGPLLFNLAMLYSGLIFTLLLLWSLVLLLVVRRAPSPAAAAVTLPCHNATGGCRVSGDGALGSAGGATWAAAGQNGAVGNQTEAEDPGYDEDVMYRFAGLLASLQRYMNAVHVEGQGGMLERVSATSALAQRQLAHAAKHVAACRGKGLPTLLPQVRNLLWGVRHKLVAMENMYGELDQALMDTYRQDRHLLLHLDDTLDAMFMSHLLESDGGLQALHHERLASLFVLVEAGVMNVSSRTSALVTSLSILKDDMQELRTLTITQALEKLEGARLGDKSRPSWKYRDLGEDDDDDDDELEFSRRYRRHKQKAKKAHAKTPQTFDEVLDDLLEMNAGSKGSHHPSDWLQQLLGVLEPGSKDTLRRVIEVVSECDAALGLATADLSGVLQRERRVEAQLQEMHSAIDGVQHLLAGWPKQRSKSSRARAVPADAGSDTQGKEAPSAGSTHRSKAGPFGLGAAGNASPSHVDTWRSWIECGEPLSLGAPSSGRVAACLQERTRDLQARVARMLQPSGL